MKFEYALNAVFSPDEQKLIDDQINKSPDVKEMENCCGNPRASVYSVEGYKFHAYLSCKCGIQLFRLVKGTLNRRTNPRHTR